MVVLGALRSLSLAFILKSTKHAPKGFQGPLLFLFTVLIAVDHTNMHRHKSLHKFLEANPTPPSKEFDYAEWRSFSIESFRELVNKHPEVAVRMLRFVFMGKELRDLGQRNVGEAVQAAFTARGAFESEASLRAEVAQLERIIEPLGPFSPTPTAFDYLRPNNPKTNPMPLTPIYYPLVVQVPKFLVRLATDMVLRVQGYSKRRDASTGIVYWSRTSDINAPTALFFHGIGMGLVPYLHFVPSFASDVPNAILVEFPGISAHPLREDKLPPYPACDEIAASIRAHLKMTLNASSKIVAVAHSFGTMVLSAIMNKHPDTFDASVYIDPVNFFAGAWALAPILYIPISLRVFLDCIWTLDVFKFVTHLAAGDIYTQHLIKNVQEFGEYASRQNDDTCLVVLSGNDPLVDAHGIQVTCKASTEVWLNKNYMHGDVVVRPEFHRKLKAWVDGVVRKWQVQENSFVNSFKKGDLRRTSASCGSLSRIGA
mmetsp:Transcript_3330/g.6337  ORF Transcript_3330/g.6337 Transcript_3330/m.6337 type:complete len:484 (-) Transcript_3330:44-1495(-)